MRKRTMIPLLVLHYAFGTATMVQRHVTRRTAILTGATSGILRGQRNVAVADVSPSNLEETDKEDVYARTSFGGLVQPPIESTVTYDKMLQMVARDEIQAVQPAVQENWVVAITSRGHRLACHLVNSTMDTLALDLTGSRVAILPLSPWRMRLHAAAELTLQSVVVILGLDKAGLLPWDLTPYPSMAARNNATRAREDRDGEHGENTQEKK